jgi:hypothetical protein
VVNQAQSSFGQFWKDKKGGNMATLKGFGDLSKVQIGTIIKEPFYVTRPGSGVNVYYSGNLVPIFGTRRWSISDIVDQANGTTWITIVDSGETGSVAIPYGEAGREEAGRRIQFQNANKLFPGGRTFGKVLCELHRINDSTFRAVIPKDAPPAIARKHSVGRTKDESRKPYAELGALYKRISELHEQGLVPDVTTYISYGGEVVQLSGTFTLYGEVVITKRDRLG